MKILQDDLPLFPLNTVLFPQAHLPLHIFEPRYREMIERCLKENLAFGIALIKEGSEVGGLAIPHTVGTIAHIIDVTRLADDRLNIVVKGVTRFKLRAHSTARAYLTGQIELLPDDIVEPATVAVAQTYALQLFERFLRVAHALSTSDAETASPDLNLPTDPTALSYLIASVLPISNRDKQTLLQIPTTAARLRRELPILEREMELLRLLATPSDTVRDQGTFSLN